MSSVYLSGPMVGLTWPEAIGWRQKVREQLFNLGYTVLVPGRTEPWASDVYNNVPMSNGSAADLLKHDMLDVRDADIVLVNLLQWSEGAPATGTFMELGAAYALNKKIIVVLRSPNEHPFLKEAATKVVTSLEEAVAWLERVHPAYQHAPEHRAPMGFRLPHNTPPMYTVRAK